MLRPDDQSKDYESTIGGMTLDSASSTGMEERRIKDMEREPDIKEEQGGVDKKCDHSEMSNCRSCRT